MNGFRRLAWVVLFAVAGCASTAPPAPVTGGTPQLVVILVVDGLPERQVVDYRDQLSPDGLERFFTRGAWFTNAHYGYSHTVTSPGHATIMTGAYPHRSGIVGNQWIDPATGAVETSVGDAAAPFLGESGATAETGSPAKLRVEALGDVVRGRDERAKVIAISNKGYSAVLSAGKRGTAYAYRPHAGEYSTTAYYMKELPAWVKEFNAGKPADRYFGLEWRPVLEDAAYSRSLADERKWYAKGGKLPKKVGEGRDKPDAAYYAELQATPFADDLELQFARAAIAGERLGKRGSEDLLVVSLSAHDHINHAYGAESRVSHDHVLQLDRMLAEFFGDLDTTLGRENYLVVLTADHGFMPAPEYSQSLGRDGGRLNAARLSARVNAALAPRFGAGAWLGPWSDDGVVLNHALIKARGVDAAALTEEARNALAAEPGIAAAYTRAELESGKPRDGAHFAAMANAYDRERSPDIMVVPKPYWMFGAGTGTTHGSPYDYDTNVPLLFYGPAWILPARIDRRVEMSGLAPTLAKILRVPAPAGSEGQVLPLDLTQR